MGGRAAQATERAMPEESTTPDLVELARRNNEAFNRGDFDGALAMSTSDAVWDLSPTGAGIFECRDAIRGFWDDWFGAYEEWEQVIEEFRDLGNGVGLGVFLQRGRPAGSSGLVDFHYAVVAIWKDGRFERIMVYTAIDEARAAAERLAEERG
jgi:ketosteroid isomerase-like protein